VATDISVQDFVLLAYKAFDCEMRGKTLLQKRVYFLSLMVGEDLGYGAHFYGPYSEEVATGNSELKSIGAVEEHVNSYGFDDRGFERALHEFKLTTFGQRVADQIVAIYPSLWQQIEAAAKKLRVSGDLDYMSLSIAAKAYYILAKEGGSAPLERIKALLPRFNWSVTDDQLKRAENFLRKASLVR